MSTETRSFDDLPKENPWTEDALGFNKFAESLANALFGVRSVLGYVVGLEGSWGSGKSTAINFTKAFIERRNATLPENERLTVIEFRPWLISGHQDVIAAFFKVLSEKLAPKKIRRRNLFKLAVRSASAGADPTFSAAATLGAAFDPSGGLGARAVTAVAKKSFSDVVDKWLQEPSLQAAYEELKSDLRARSGRVVVIIDDLDRLNSEEIRNVAQLVKSVGNLPNVIYLLAYDNRVIRPALSVSGINPEGGPHFLEKIVQHEISLPKPPQEKLLKLLDKQLESFFRPIPADERWSEFIRNGAVRWIRSARDVNRLSNAVAFTAPAVGGELDPQDLFVLEGLRLFEPHVFAWIRDNRSFLVGDNFYLSIVKEAKIPIVKEFVDGLDGISKEPIISLLCTLFPTRIDDFRSYLKGYPGTESYASVRSRRGIATQEGYEAYFSLSIGERGVSKKLVDELIARLDDYDFVEAVFTRMLAVDRKGERAPVSFLLEELEYRFAARNSPNATQAILNALVACGARIIESDYPLSGFIQRAAHYYTTVIYTLLQNLGPEEAALALADAFSRSTSALAAANIYVERGRELRVFPASRTMPAPVISSEAFEELGPNIANIIERERSNGTLADALYYWDILRAWEHVSGRDAPKSWIRSIAEEGANNFAKIALGFLSYSVGGIERSYFLRERPSEEYFSLEELRGLALKHRESSKLNDDERNRLDALATGLESFITEPELQFNNDFD